jgi:hypothetical protein
MAHNLLIGATEVVQKGSSRLLSFSVTAVSGSNVFLLFSCGLAFLGGG